MIVSDMQRVANTVIIVIVVDNVENSFKCLVPRALLVLRIGLQDTCPFLQRSWLPEDVR